MPGDGGILRPMKTTVGTGVLFFSLLSASQFEWIEEVVMYDKS